MIYLQSQADFKILHLFCPNLRSSPHFTIQLSLAFCDLSLGLTNICWAVSSQASLKVRILRYQLENTVISDGRSFQTFSSLLVRHFHCPKQKPKTTSEYKHTPNQWETWPQKPLLTTAKSFSDEEK